MQRIQTEDAFLLKQNETVRITWFAYIMAVCTQFLRTRASILAEGGQEPNRFPLALRPDVLKPDAEGKEYYRALRWVVQLAEKAVETTQPYRVDAAKPFHACQLAAARVIFEPLLHLV